MCYTKRTISMEKKKKMKEEKNEEVFEKQDSLSWSRFFGSTVEIRRSVAALFTLAFSLFFVFSFFSSAGIMGEYVNAFFAMVFGWGKWIFPIILFSIVWFLLRGKAHLYYVSIFSLFICFFSMLGIFHLFVDVSDMRQVALEGGAGGYIGYMIVSMMIPLFGFAVSSIFLSIFFFSGMFIAFGVSFFPFVRKLNNGSFPPFVKKVPQEQEGAELSEAEFQEKDFIEMEGNIIQEDTVISEEDRVLHPQVTNVRFEGEETPSFSKRFEIVRENNRENNSIQSNILSSSLKEENPKEEDNEEEDSVLKGEKKPRKRRKRKKPYAWNLPPLHLLSKSSEAAHSGDVRKKKRIVVDTLAEFGISVTPVAERIGPTVTQYRFRPAAGVKLEKILGLTSNLTLALRANSIRLEAPIPGEGLIGIEVPNERVAKVSLWEVLKSSRFQELAHTMKLPVALGKDVSGEVVFGSLTTMPHLLIAGTTGSGKSVCINSIILSLLFAYGPRDLRFILVDPKQVELSKYQDIPLLKGHVIVDMKKAVGALRWAVDEMEKRYKLLAQQGVRDILSYNEKVRSNTYIGEDDLETLPFIVIVLEEFSDLMMTSKKDIEVVVARLAQKSRAVGIHLILCTQRPSVEAVTGLIKTNISTRISFKVASSIDSRTVLDQTGAEKLLGNGDMLYKTAEDPKPRRIQGVYASTEEVDAVVEYILDHNIDFSQESEDVDEIDEREEGQVLVERSVGGKENEDRDFEAYGKESERDSLYENAKELVIMGGEASASLLQRQLSVGYNRASKLLDALHEEGIIGPKNGAKGRDVLVGPKSLSVSNEENSTSIVD